MDLMLHPGHMKGLVNPYISRQCVCEKFFSTFFFLKTENQKISFQYSIFIVYLHCIQSKKKQMVADNAFQTVFGSFSQDNNGRAMVTAEAYEDVLVGSSTCYEWFLKFKLGQFDLEY